MEFLAKYSIVLIPVLIFLITMGMKVAIGKDLHEITFGFVILEIPVNILFISIALTITFISKNEDKASAGITLMMIQLFLAFISVVIWKFSAKYLSDEKLFPCALLGLLNYNLTVWPLFYIINLNV